MQIISYANDGILKILARFHQHTSGGQLIAYCLDIPMEEGVLLFNLLTREMVLLSEEEWEKHLENDYLKGNWFVVPEDCKEKEYADLVKWVLTNKQPKKRNITGYTIFPTTDCNARCFYCFELGRSRIPMTEETAHKVARYIADHCGGERVKLSWFGGEPLCNLEVIDIICSDLRERNVEFVSRATSNGYLFDAKTVKKAVCDWNLKWVQITLDGTEQVYNKTKAFIYKTGSAYQTVLTNIGHLLDAKVAVHIRLNMDMYNAEDLLALVEELSCRFESKKGLSVYAHHLFKGDEPLAEAHTDEEWEKRDEAMRQLSETIQQNGLADTHRISRDIRLNHCMADSGRAVTILPNGEIGLCEHHSESEFIGHIDREGFDEDVVKSWKERILEIPECARCFYYPECTQLKKCTNDSVCFQQFREEKRRKVQQEMLFTYQQWKEKKETDQTEDDVLC